MMGCSLLSGAVLLGIGARATETADARPLVEKTTPTDGGTVSGDATGVPRPGLEGYAVAAGK